MKTKSIDVYFTRTDDYSATIIVPEIIDSDEIFSCMNTMSVLREAAEEQAELLEEGMLEFCNTQPRTETKEDSVCPAVQEALLAEGLVPLGFFDEPKGNMLTYDRVLEIAEQSLMFLAGDDVCTISISDARRVHITLRSSDDFSVVLQETGWSYTLQPNGDIECTRLVGMDTYTLTPLGRVIV